MNIMYIGVVYTNDKDSNDVVTIYANDRQEADFLLDKYIDKMYDDIDEITVLGRETYMPLAPDATVVRRETIDIMI